jgi:2-C-methyl-D-erythritol 4-phosphate cytidylyltransferase
VVAAPPGWEEPVILLAEELVASKVAAVVTGGASRAESVRNGLAEIPEDALVVLVHDAARPLVDDAMIERLLGRLAEGVDGVVPGVSIGDTVKRVDGGIVAETIDRATLVAVQTPQGFAGPLLRRAHRAMTADATDDASMVEALGEPVVTVPGESANLKVTTPRDLVIARALFAASEGEASEG